MTMELPKVNDRVTVLPNAFGGGKHGATVIEVGQMPSLWLPEGETRLAVMIQLDGEQYKGWLTMVLPDQISRQGDEWIVQLL